MKNEKSLRWNKNKENEEINFRESKTEISLRVQHHESQWIYTLMIFTQKHFHRKEENFPKNPFGRRDWCASAKIYVNYICTKKSESSF